MREKLCLIRFSGQCFAIPSGQVVQVVQAPRVFPLPPTRCGFNRVFMYQGELVPLLPFERFLAAKPDFRQDVCYLVVCCTTLGLLGLAVDQVAKVVDAAAGALVATAREELPWCDTDFLFAEQRYSYLDFDRLSALLPELEGGMAGHDPKEA